MAVLGQGYWFSYLRDAVRPWFNLLCTAMAAAMSSAMSLMNKTKLIVVDGVPGAGKTTTAAFIDMAQF
jgi:hypothetical protein